MAVSPCRPTSFTKQCSCTSLLSRIRADLAYACHEAKVWSAESDKQILEQLDASMAEAGEGADSDEGSDGSASEGGYYDIGDGDDEDLMREVLHKVSR